MPTKAKPAPKKPADKPEETPAVEPILEDDPTDTSDTPEPADDTTGDADAEEDADEDETGLVTDPCRVHYPDGWPVAEEGAWADCPHGHGIRYGDQVQITKARAVELGFITDEEQGR